MTTSLEDDKEKSKTTEEELLKNKNGNDGEDLEEEEDSEDVEALKAQNKRLFERAKQAEVERKSVMPLRKRKKTEAHNAKQLTTTLMILKKRS